MTTLAAHAKLTLSLRITGSFGLATYPTDADSKVALVRLADKAMYEAKDASRDAVRTA